MKNIFKLSISKRPPIEVYYRKQLAENTIRYEKIAYAKQKLFGLLIFSTIFILFFKYKVFPYVNSLSEHCELWQGIDVIFLLFYFILIFPIIFALLFLYFVLKDLCYLNKHHERMLKRTGYPNYRIYQKVMDKQLTIERLKLLFTIITLIIFIAFFVSSAIKYNDGFFGVNSQLKHPLNPFRLKYNSQIMQKLCLEKNHTSK